MADAPVAPGTAAPAQDTPPPAQEPQSAPVGADSLPAGAGVAPAPPTPVPGTTGDTPDQPSMTPLPPAQNNEAPGPKDDLGPTFAANKSQQSANAVLGKLNQELGSKAEDPATKLSDPTVTPDDPLGIKVTNSAWSFAKTATQATVELPMAVTGGVNDAVIGTVKALGGLSQWLYSEVSGGDEATIVDTIVKKVESSLKVGEQQTMAPRFVRSATEFTVGFIPFLKAVKGVTLGLEATTAGRMLQSTLAAGTSSAVVLDPYESRLSNLLSEHTELSKPVWDFLKADPNDAEATARFKNGLENMGFGVVADGFFAAVSAIKANRLAAGLAPSAKLAEEAKPLESLLGDLKSPFASEELAKKIAAGKATPEEVSAGLNFTRLSSDTQIEKAIKSYQQLLNNSHSTPTQGSLLSVGEHISPNELVVWHGSSQKGLQSFKNPSKVNDYFRYDGGTGSAYGPFTYFDETGKWINGTIARGISTSGGVYKVKLSFDKPFTLTPKSTQELRNILKVKKDAPPLTGEQISAGLKNAGYDGVIVRGFDDLGKAPIPEELGITLDAAQDQIVSFSPQKNAKILGIAAKGKDKTSKRLMSTDRASIDDEAVISLSSKLGITPQDLIMNQFKASGGKVVSTGRIEAANNLYDAITSKLMEVSKIATDSTDPKVLLDFINMNAVHSNMSSYLKGGAQDGGKALMFPKGSTAKQIADLNEIVMSHGGPNEIRKWAAVIKDMAQDLPAASRNAIIGRAQWIAKGTWGQTKDIVMAFRYFDLLTSPMTHALNAMGSAGNLGWEIGVRKLANTFGSSGRVVDGEASAMAQSLAKSAWDGLQMVSKALFGADQATIDAAVKGIKESEAGKSFITMQGSARRSGKVPAPPSNTVSAANFGLTGPDGTPINALGHFYDAIGTMLSIPTRTLIGVDDLFKTAAKSAQMSALAHRQATLEGLVGDVKIARTKDLMNNPSPEMFHQADDFGNYVTYNTKLGSFGQAGSRFVNSNIFTKILVPFFDISARMGNWAIDHSPLAIATQRYADQIAAGGAAADVARARIAAGGIAMLAVTDQAFKDNITGASPKDPGLRQVWENSGKKPYSFRNPFTGEWIPYGNFGAFGQLLGTAASYGNLAGSLNPHDADKMIGAAAIATSSSILNRTFMQDLSDWAAAMSNEHAMERFLQRQVSSFVPGGAGLGFIRQQTDPLWRDVQSITDAIVNKFPWGPNSLVPGSQDLPPDTNLWGEHILVNGILGPDTISPTFETIPTNAPINKYMEDNQVGVTKPTRTQGSVRGSDGIELTPQEYYKFNKLAGNDLKLNGGLGCKDYLNATIEGKTNLSAQWAKGSDGPNGTRADMIRGVIMVYRMAAWGHMVTAKDPDLASLQTRWKQSIQENVTRKTQGPWKWPTLGQ